MPRHLRNSSSPLRKMAVHVVYFSRTLFPHSHPLASFLSSRYTTQPFFSSSSAAVAAIKFFLSSISRLSYDWHVRQGRHIHTHTHTKKFTPRVSNKNGTRQTKKNAERRRRRIFDYRRAYGVHMEKSLCIGMYV